MNDKQRLLIKVSRLYYQDGLTQEFISRKLRLSRPKVSRLLREALETGIVKISVAQEPGCYAEIEREIEDRYGLLEVVVADVRDYDSPALVSQDLGPVAAGYFSRMVQDGDVIGFTWGTTLAAMVDNLQPEQKREVVLVQMVGGLGGPNTETHATDLLSRVSFKIGATLRPLPAPGIVKQVEATRLLLSEQYITQALQMASEADIAFAGIGAPTRDSTLLRDESIITWDEVAGIVAMGAVGEIGLHFFDVNGEPVHTELDERVIGVSLDRLRSISRVVGIAGGKDKFKAVLGAVRGGFINSLITDSVTAQKLLEIR